MTLLDQAKERFENDDTLRPWLPVLREYVFADIVLVQLIQKPAPVVAQFCEDIDE